MITHLRRVWSFLTLAPGREQLSYLLETADPKASLEDRVHWFERLIFWVKTSSVAADDSGELHASRLRFFFHLLEKNLEWKSKVAATLRALILDTDSVDLFCQAGLSRDGGFLHEAFELTVRRFLPTPPRYRNAAELFQRVFASPDDAEMIRRLPSELTLKLAELLRFDRRARDEKADTADIFDHVQRAMIEALAILGSQVSAIGTSVEIRRRLTDPSASNSPFLRLNERILNAVEDFREDKALTPEAMSELGEALGSIKGCREALDQVFRHLEKSGVSVSLVFLLERQLRALARLETLIRFMTGESRHPAHRLAADFLASVIVEQTERRSVRGLMSSNLHLLSRKISERSGASGEHYITHTRAEYFAMLRSAAGGGAVTVGTALGKFVVTAMKAPPFFDALFSSIVYAGSFLLMQVFGFALATKQPSMTAAAIAGKLDHVDRDEGVKELVTEFACLTRSQFAAAVGNVGVAVPGAILFDLLFRNAFHRHVLSYEYSEHAWTAHHPFLSLSIWYAALTGVLLFTASVFAGWLENFVVLHDIPEAIAQNRSLRRIFGEKLPKRLANGFLHQIAAVGGNTSIGVLLGSTQVLGRFFGAPLEVRHLTLSSATLAFALCSLSDRGLTPDLVLWPILGLGLIGLMNFGVSFALALFTAARARNVETSTLGRIAQEIVRRLLSSPVEFLYAKGTPQK